MALYNDSSTSNRRTNKTVRGACCGGKDSSCAPRIGKAGVAVQFTPKPVARVSLHSDYGCIGIDMNPVSIGWAYVDAEGNLKAKGQIPLQMGLPSGKQDAQIVDACLQLVTLASTYACPVCR